MRNEVDGGESTSNKVQRPLVDCWLASLTDGGAVRSAAAAAGASAADADGTCQNSGVQQMKTRKGSATKGTLSRSYLHCPSALPPPTTFLLQEEQHHRLPSSLGHRLLHLLGRRE